MRDDLTSVPRLKKEEKKGGKGGQVLYFSQTSKTKKNEKKKGLIKWKSNSKEGVDMKKREKLTV